MEADSRKKFETLFEKQPKPKKAWGQEALSSSPSTKERKKEDDKERADLRKFRKRLQDDYVMGRETVSPVPQKALLWWPQKPQEKKCGIASRAKGPPGVFFPYISPSYTRTSPLARDMGGGRLFC
jgi:hypothetical protein